MMFCQLSAPIDFTDHGIVIYMWGSIILLTFSTVIWLVISYTSKISILWENKIDKSKFDDLLRESVERKITGEHDKKDKEELKEDMKELKKSIESLEKQLHEKARVDSEILKFMIRIEDKIGI